MFSILHSGWKSYNSRRYSAAMGRVYRIIAVSLLALMFAGCLNVGYDIKIHSEDQIEVRVDLSVDKAKAQASKRLKDPNDLCNGLYQAASQSGFAAQPYQSDERLGCKLSGTVNLQLLNAGGTLLELSDGVWRFHVRGGDLRGRQLNESAIDTLNWSVTFPGEVLTHSGSSTVNGTTVTWTDPADLFSQDGLQATAKDAPKSGLSAWVWGAMAAGLVGAVLLLFWVRRR